MQPSWMGVGFLIDMVPIPAMRVELMPSEAKDARAGAKDADDGANDSSSAASTAATTVFGGRTAFDLTAAAAERLTREGKLMREGRAVVGRAGEEGGERRARLLDECSWRES